VHYDVCEMGVAGSSPLQPKNPVGLVRLGPGVAGRLAARWVETCSKVGGDLQQGGWRLAARWVETCNKVGGDLVHDQPLVVRLGMGGGAGCM
jgi:hypothetical protein